MPPHILPKSIPRVPIGQRDTIGLRRRRHIRRQLSVPDLVPDVPGVPDKRGITTAAVEVRDTDEEEEGEGEEEELTTDDEEPAGGPAAQTPPAPTPAAPPALTPSSIEPATQPAAALPSVPIFTVPTVSISVLSATLVTVTETAAAAPPASSSGIAAISDSFPTAFTTITRPFSVTSTRESLRTTFTVDFDDDDELPTATVVIVPPSVSFPQPPGATSTSTDDRPVIAPTNPALVYNDGPPPESRTAITAAVSIICISLFFGIVYCLFRFCPPIRGGWVAFRLRRKHERQKRMGMQEESPMPPPVVVVNGRQQPSTWAAGGLGVRNVGIENGVLRPLSEAHLRPPSYRSHWTQSGASWVANGFRLPERLSQRMRWSDRSGRRFMGRGMRPGSDTDSVSSFGGGGLVANGLRPPLPEVSRLSATTAPTMNGGDGPESIGSIKGRPSSGGGSKRASRSSHSQAGFSTHARISDMSSLSAGTMSNGFRPPPILSVPIGIARGSGSGLMRE